MRSVLWSLAVAFQAPLLRGAQPAGYDVAAFEYQPAPPMQPRSYISESPILGLAGALCVGMAAFALTKRASRPASTSTDLALLAVKGLTPKPQVPSGELYDPLGLLQKARTSTPVMQSASDLSNAERSKAATSFEQGMRQFEADFPWLAKYGFGPTVKAERWNGRHAMFGWFAIIATGYAKAHGLFPDANTALTYKDWGGLTQMGFNQYISNERAIIMIAHIHALGVSFAAAFGPQVLGDTLTLLDGEQDEEPYGLFPPMIGQSGLTPAAEMLNGRLAMLGIIAVVSASMTSGQDILTVVDNGLGGLLLKQ